jgi:hypothetical protein
MNMTEYEYPPVQPGVGNHPMLLSSEGAEHIDSGKYPSRILMP